MIASGTIGVDNWRSAPNGKAPVSKTGGRKPLQVRVLSPPPREMPL